MQPGLRHLGDAGEDVGEPVLGVDVVELGGADERIHHRRPLAAETGAREQPGFASETERLERPLGGIRPLPRRAGAGEADIERAPAGTVEVARDPVAALAPAVRQVLRADGLGVLAERGGDGGRVHGAAPWNARDYGAQG